MNNSLDFQVSNSPEDIMNIAGVGAEKSKTRWLYDLAMEHANNNHYLAMRLTGVCGHDDKYQQGDDII